MYEDVTYAVHGEVGLLTLNRPAVRNALRPQTYAELEDAVRRATVRALVLTGADPAFCSGDDVRAMFTEDGAQAEQMLAVDGLLSALDALLYTDIPIIAAVNGPAVGWGMELALSADLRVASERASFAEYFVLRGLPSDVLGMARLPQLVGRERAAELLFTGRRIDASTAENYGLVTRVVPHEGLLPTSLELAEEIARRPPLAVAKIKESLRLGADPDWHELGRWNNAAQKAMLRTEDHREGVASFLEKREPTFHGR